MSVSSLATQRNLAHEEDTESRIMFPLHVMDLNSYGKSGRNSVEVTSSTSEF